MKARHYFITAFIITVILMFITPSHYHVMIATIGVISAVFFLVAKEDQVVTKSNSQQYKEIIDDDDLAESIEDAREIAKLRNNLRKASAINDMRNAG